MTLTPAQQKIVDDITTALDAARKGLDLAAAFGLGTIPGIPEAKLVFDAVDSLWDAADSWQKGTLTAIQAAVRAADAQADALVDATFPADKT